MSRGKGGAPKVFNILCRDNVDRKVIARSPKGARMILERAGFKVTSGLNFRAAVIQTNEDPKTASKALNFEVKP